MEQFEDLLLRSARNGDCKTVEEILQARKDGKVNLDISCKGKCISHPSSSILSHHLSIHRTLFLPSSSSISFRFPLPFHFSLLFLLSFPYSSLHSLLPTLAPALCPFLSLCPLLYIQPFPLPLFLSTFLNSSMQLFSLLSLPPILPLSLSFLSHLYVIHFP